MRSRFRPARELLPSLLSGLAERSGNAGALLPIWRQAVGGALARAGSPVGLRAGVLYVEARAPWDREIARHADEILRRLVEALGAGKVRAIEVVTIP